MCGNSAVVKTLLEAGADPNVADKVTLYPALSPGAIAANKA
jgi:hypothetical protein